MTVDDSGTDFRSNSYSVGGVTTLFVGSAYKSLLRLAFRTKNFSVVVLDMCFSLLRLILSTGLSPVMGSALTRSFELPDVTSFELGSCYLDLDLLKLTWSLVVAVGTLSSGAFRSILSFFFRSCRRRSVFGRSVVAELSC